MNPIHLTVGSRGPDVKVLQEKLRLKADGVFGPMTERAVMKFTGEYNTHAEFMSERVRSDGVVDASVWLAAGLSAYARRVPVPVRANSRDVRPARQSTMLALFGAPRENMSAQCAVVTNKSLSLRMAYGHNVGPFRVNGLKLAVNSLVNVFGDILTEEPGLYVRLSNAGMLCVRAVRGSKTNWSNHSWGTAIDLMIDGMLDPCADGHCQFGLQCAARIFNRHGWYWGAEFGREDSMHFEAGEALVRTWA